MLLEVKYLRNKNGEKRQLRWTGLEHSEKESEPQHLYKLFSFDARIKEFRQLLT